jgi:hypothetical protein
VNLNDFLINNNSNSLFTRSTSTYSSPVVISSPENDASKAGDLYLSTATNSASLGLLGGTVTITLQISNQSTNKTMYVSRVSGSIDVPLNLLSSFSGNVKLVKGGTILSPTIINSINANFSSTNTSAMTSRSSTSEISGGTTFLAFQLDSGQFSIDFFGGILVPPGNSLAVSVNASLSLLGLLSTTVNIMWWEHESV